MKGRERETEGRRGARERESARRVESAHAQRGDKKIGMILKSGVRNCMSI